jgi:hypothetical protein
MPTASGRRAGLLATDRREARYGRPRLPLAERRPAGRHGTASGNAILSANCSVTASLLLRAEDEDLLELPSGASVAGAQAG